MQTSNMAVSKHAESFVVGCFRSGTLNDTPTEMTASMGSSHQVFFSPRVQLNLHVAQTLMWLLGATFLSVLSLGVNMGFTKPLGPLS